MIDVLSPPGATPPPAEPPPSPAMPPPEPTAPAEVKFQSRLTHEHRSLPDFGKLTYTRNADHEELQITSETPGFSALSFACRKVDAGNQHSHELTFRAPNNLRINNEWPDSPKHDGGMLFGAQEITIRETEREGGGGTVIENDTLLPVAVASVRQVIQQDGSLTEARYPIAKTFGDLGNEDAARGILFTLGQALDYTRSLNMWVAKPPIGDVPFDPAKHNITWEALTFLQNARNRLQEEYRLIYDEAKKRNPNAFR